MKKIFFFTMICLFLLTLPISAQINLLHEFAGGAADGAFPMGNLVLSGSTLYGTTRLGGYADYGKIFKVQTDGSGYTILWEFTGGGNNGRLPYEGLVLSGSTLYGTTDMGGDSDFGTIFSISIYGNGFTLLHEFVSGMDGRSPEGQLLLSGTTLYGVTQLGGESGYGTVFKIQTNGTGYTQLHAFSGGAYDGSHPLGSLILSGSTLYGMTIYGGDSDKGTIYKIQTDGNGFALLHEFAGGADDGMYAGHLILSGLTLYGMTSYGGNSNLGTIFKMSTAGTGFALLHEFAGGVDDGATPGGGLILSGSTLFGMPMNGGDSNLGVVFKIETDGSGFTLLHEFAGGANDGSNPHGPLLLSGSILYGTTSNGGDADRGVIFSMPIAETTGKDDFIGTWDGQGVYYRNSDSGAFVKLASPATLIAAGDLDNDFIDDLIGIWPGQGGVWVKYSATGAWAKLSSTARHIATGDMNGDGRPELLGTWDGQGVFWRNNTSGAWTKLATPATLITAGDLDSDGTDDLIGIWPSQGGVWVKYSQSGAWAKLSTTAVDIATGDMNGDGRDDLVATWDGQGVYYRNSNGGAWVKMATPATQVTAGDLDGDGIDDVIGIWPSQAGVWVKYSHNGAWALLSSAAVDIAAGRMRAAGSSSLQEPGSTTAVESENSWGPDAGAEALDFSANAPGGMSFISTDGGNMEPRESGDVLRVPGPGEPGFQCQEQKNQIPGSVIIKREKSEENSKQQ